MLCERPVAENAWQVDEGLYRILLPLPWSVPFVNAFVVESQGQFMLIDCGLNWEPSLRALGRALKAIGVPSRGLTYLLLTHRHLDHSSGVGPVHQRWGGTVLLHPTERNWQVVRPQAQLEWLADHGLPAHLLTAAAVRRLEDELPPETAVLDEDQPLVLGDLAFDVLPAPGHSPGQVMLREPKRGWLFTADHVLSTLAPNVWFQPGDTDPLGTYLDGLDRLAEQETRLMLPGHGMPTAGALGQAASAMAQFHRQFIARVQTALSAGPDTTWAVTQRVYTLPDPSPLQARDRLAEVLAALAWLERRGQVAPDQTSANGLRVSWN